MSQPFKYVKDQLNKLKTLFASKGITVNRNPRRSINEKSLREILKAIEELDGKAVRNKEDT